MINPAEYKVEQIQFSFLMLVRIVAMIQTFPVFGSRNVPWQIKIGLSLFLTVILFPLVQPRIIELPNNILPYAMLIMKEALVGLVIGFVASLVFTAISIAGAMIDMQVGFAMARSIDPLTGVGTTVLGNFQVFLFTLIFLALQGHQFLIIALARSFVKIPVAAAVLPYGKLANIVTYLISNIFDVSVRLAAPVVIFVLLISVASGILSRTLPQMNLFVVALPAKIAVSIMAVAMSFPVLSYVFEKAYNQLQDDIYNLLLIMT